MLSSESSFSTFPSHAINHTLDLLGLIETANPVPELVEQWTATGEPFRFDGALRLADRWMPSQPPSAVTDNLMPAVLFLLGWPQSTAEALMARQVLVPHLHHPLPESRWAAALSLGWLQDDRALPMLAQMLTEYLPKDDAVAYTAEDGLPYDPRLDWWRCTELLHIILYNNAALFAGPLRAALDRVLELERRWVACFGPPVMGSEVRREWPEVNSPGIEHWALYQDTIIFALGQLGAFDSVRTVDCPLGLVGVQAWWYLGEVQPVGDERLQRFPFRPLLWCVHAVMGHLFHQLPLFPLRRDPASPLVRFRHYEGLAERVMALLVDAFHLAPDEQVAAMAYYEESLYLDGTLALSREVLHRFHLRKVE